MSVKFCLACNCHGHSQECIYDAEVAEGRMSLNMNGEYLGGGVCVGCRDNTAGNNCETYVYVAFLHAKLTF